ncbi:sodium:solute symporter family protein [Rickettsiales endosymbiont of Stachyamoeba lipophora]|uniref:sodium:solute symporter family protein n=1 Tax=Rickettsiales endosymbiont of Stachyamoeba lipophora TaxID=2486578 RepID=UPI000F655E79|nr:sodium:solute symporter family protein [Rickettsiales endosymbiont of Stachyamoeba lipophora]AZL14991.1 sodium:solute symporter family protein [Rickettsiales endosymbiont of Stachyamoeba lipophora]
MDNTLTFLDNAIIVLYLAATLIIGIVSGKNVKTIKDYAIGDYKFSTSFLVATVCATWLDSGSTFGITEKIYKYGIVYLIIFLSESIKMISITFIAPNLEKFRGMLSVGEIMGSLYGKPGRIICGIAATLFCLGLVGAQINAIGYIFNKFLGMDTLTGILIGCGIVIIYSTFGGIKSVTYTDAMHMGCFAIAVPIIIICYIMIGKIGSYNYLLAMTPASHLQLFPNTGTPIEFIFIFLLFAIPFLDPALVQRILMAKDKNQIATTFKITAAVIIPFYILAATTALSIFVLHPNLDPSSALPFAVKNYLPSGIKGLAITGLIAVVMSSADSFLNTSAISVVHDLINPLRSEPLTSQQELLTTKIATLVIGLLSILVAVKFNSVIDIIMKFQNTWGPVIVVPLFAGIFRIKASSRSFIHAVIAGLSVVIIWMYFGLEAKLGFDSPIPGLIANGITFFISNYYYKRTSFSTWIINQDI